jgi:MurNAc alpha-1-phosphate uridylyltransferase
MEALLLLVPRSQALGHTGAGDFALDATGRLARGGVHVYTGAQILCTEGLSEVTDSVFSLNHLWDRAADRGGLFGVIYEGSWCDVGRPENLVLAERLLSAASPRV